MFLHAADLKHIFGNSLTAVTTWSQETCSITCQPQLPVTIIQLFFLLYSVYQAGIYSFKGSFQGFMFIGKHPKTARQTMNGLIFGGIFASEIWGLLFRRGIYLEFYTVLKI